MKEATYTVLTKSGKELQWNFTECEPGPNAGNNL